MFCRLNRLSAVLLLFLLGACFARVDEAAPRHVLLVVVDTLRADYLSCYGFDEDTSPQIDQLAASGVRFERAYSQSSWTSPSMVSMFTGHYIAEDRLAVPESIPTISEVFRSEGWKTAAFVSNGILSPEQGFARGFDEFHDLKPYASVESVYEWLEGRRDEKTFTWIHLNIPHDPYAPPDEFDRFRSDPPKLSAEEFAYLDRVHDELGLRDKEPSLVRIRAERAGYADDIRFTDVRIGGLVAKLHEFGIYDETAIVFAADHGEGLWTRRAFRTGEAHEDARDGEAPTLVNTLKMTHGNQVHTELVHVPLILSGPCIPRGRSVPGVVENVDIAPTLFELCDLRDPGGLHGQSLLGCATDADFGKRAAFSHTRYNSTLLTDNNLQLILPTDLGVCEEGLELQVFDLATDPFARKNVASEHEAEVPGLVRRLLDRRSLGICDGSLVISHAALDALTGLGYVRSGITQRVSTELGRLSSDELLRRAEHAESCLERLEALRMLAIRELGGDDVRRLKDRLARESSPAVRAAIASIVEG